MFGLRIPLRDVYWVCVCASMCISPCWPRHGVVGRHLQCSRWSDQIDVCRPHRSCCHFPLSARPPAPSPQGGHTDRSPVPGVCSASNWVVRLLVDKCLQQITAWFMKESAVPVCTGTPPQVSLAPRRRRWGLRTENASWWWGGVCSWWLQLSSALSHGVCW